MASLLGARDRSRSEYNIEFSRRYRCNVETDVSAAGHTYTQTKHDAMSSAADASRIQIPE